MTRARSPARIIICTWRAANSSPWPGVEDVDRFDETGIVMTTSAGVLIITGSNLHIGKLSLEGGELHVDGQIDSLAYEDDRRQGGGFFSRLFG